MEINTVTELRIRARRVSPALAMLLPLFLASCVASTPIDGEGDGGGSSVASGDEAISRDDAISRAEEWVKVELHYCQSPNHEPDYDAACSSVCNRHDNAKWDPYRSDCSGLVSWAWGLPAPGRTTLGFAPFETDITHAISASDLEPGDAINNADHVMLFKHWVDKDHKATFIEEPGCSSSTPYAHEVTSDVSVSGSHVYVSYNGMSFTAIRYHGVTNKPPPPPAKKSDRIAVSTRGPGELDLFARDNEDRLIHSAYRDNKWTDWKNLGGELHSAPAAISWAADRLDVFSTDKHDHLTHISHSDGEWSKWEELDGHVKTAPAVASWEAYRLDVFAVDEHEHLIHKAHAHPGGWGKWQDLGGHLAGPPTAVSWGVGRIDVFACDTHDKLAHIAFANGAWTAWQTNGPCKTGPAVASRGEGQLDLFAANDDGELRHRHYDAKGWGDWGHLGGDLVSHASAVSWGPDRLDVFFRGDGDKLDHRAHSVKGWKDWSEGDRVP
jgi:hypothetical protein